MNSASDGLDSEEILRATPPPDDSGAETADRFEWQAGMATADALTLYFASLDDAGCLLDGADFSLLCEHHEDWSVLHNGTSEIVSGKHREASVGPYSTFRQIVDEGGVLHLFKRWRALQQSPKCRLVTTAGLRGDAAKLARVCEKLQTDPDSQDGDVLAVIDGVANTVAILSTGGTFAPEPAEIIRAFLIGQRFQVAEPRRDHVPDLAGRRYGRPVSERLGHPDRGDAVWLAVLGLVRPRMRNAGPSTGGALPAVLGIQHDDALASRTLTLVDVHTAVRFALANPAGYAPLPRIIKANRMAVKMSKGGCTDNAVERADALRLQYRQYWRSRRSSPSMSDQRRTLENTLLRVVDETTAVVRREEGDWGARLWRELGQRFEVMEGHGEAQGLSPDLLLGGVSELANSCRAWYTDRFDAQAVLKQLIAQGAAS